MVWGKRKEEELSCLIKYSLINMLKRAPNLVDFSVCKSYFKNVVNSGATSLCGQILNYKKQLTTQPQRGALKLNSVNAVELKNII